MSEVPGSAVSPIEDVQSVELLRTAAYKGWVADFDGGSCVPRLEAKQINGHLEGPPSREIDANDIRNVLMELAHGAVLSEDISPIFRRKPAVRLYKVTITGVLELDDAAGPGGSELPRLEFTKCWFKEKHIRLERCRIRSFCMRSCAFSELQASEAVIKGPVDLSYARASGADHKDPYKCWVVLAGAQIDGRINAARSAFVAPEERQSDKWVLYSKHSRYALDLRSTRIRGSIQLRPDMTARGGVCLTLAKVEGSVWANGAQMDALEECSFAADYAEIQGSLYFRPYDGPEEKIQEKGVPEAKRKQFISNGCMGFLAVKVGGSIYFEGAHLTARHWLPRDDSAPVNRVVRWEETSVVNLSTSVIHGHCVFRSWIPEPAISDSHTGHAVDPKVWDFVGDGDIILSAAVIHNDLSFDGARVRFINAQNIEVSGSCYLGTYSNPKVKHPNPFVAWNSVSFVGGRIRGSLSMNGARIGCVRDEGTIDLSKIDRTIDLIDKDGRVTTVRERLLQGQGSHKVQIAPQRDEENGFLAAGLRVGGFCSMATFESDSGQEVFRFECAGRVSLEDATIGNYFCMDGARVVCEKVAINLSGCAIGGKASFRVVKGRSGRQAGEGFAFSAWGGDTAVKLNGAKMAFGLNMNGAFLTGTRLGLAADNIDVGGKVSLGMFHVNGRHDPFPFTSEGKVSLVGATIKLQLNLSGAHLTLGKDQARTREGSGFMDVLDLTLVRAKGIWLGKHECLNGGMSEEERKFKADGRVVLEHATVDTDLVLEGCTLWRQLSCEFAKVGGSVRLSEITMERQYDGWCLLDTVNAKAVSRLDDDEELRKWYVQRRLTPDISLNSANVGGALKVWRYTSGLERTPTDKTGDDPRLKPMLEGTSRTKIVIDLRGAVIGELDDRGGRAWGESTRFWLEGFRYNRLKEASVYHTGSTNRPMSKKIPFWVKTLLKPSYIPPLSRDRIEWEPRAGWLQQQYFDGKGPRDSTRETEGTPDAYEQAIAKLKAAGSFEDAKRISSIHLSNSGQSKVSRALIWAPFRILFDYGYSVTRALLTFVLCLLIGVVGASKAVKQGVLVPRETGASTPSVQTCGWTGKVLYAIRVFVPVLEAKSDTGCAITAGRGPNDPWRLAETSYAAVGWLVTPLVILTASGLLKRHLER